MINEKDKEKIKQDYLNGYNCKQLQLKYNNYTYYQIYGMIKREGIKRTHNNKFNNEQKEKIVRKYVEDKKTCKEIALELKCCDVTIYNILKEYNIEVHPGARSNINENYFDIIDNPHKAYILGFLTADGAIVKTSISFEVIDKDKQVLEYIKEQLNSNNPITNCNYEKKHNVRISFGSRHMVDILANYGIIQNKSKIIKDIPVLPKELMCYYFRGLIDGDGCIHKNGGISIYSGSLTFIKNVQQYLIEQVGLKYLKVYKGTTYFITWTSKEDRIKLYNYLYKDKLNNCYYYDRKYQRLLNSLIG